MKYLILLLLLTSCESRPFIYKMHLEAKDTGEEVCYNLLISDIKGVYCLKYKGDYPIKSYDRK